MTSPASRTSQPAGSNVRAHEVFLDALAHELALADPDGSEAKRLNDHLPSLARHLASELMTAGERWDAHLGGFYSTDGVRKLLGREGKPITRQAVWKRKGLLSLRTGSGEVVYPRFQFRGATLVPGLGEVLDRLPETSASPWTVASWLVSPNPELGGKPIDLLWDGHTEAVVAATERWAAALAA